MSKQLKVTIVEADQMEVWCPESEGFVFNVLSTFYFIDALGRAIWLHTRNRQEALNYIRDNYDGKYALRTARESKGSGSYSCTGTSSRKGMAANLRKTV